LDEFVPILSTGKIFTIGKRRRRKRRKVRKERTETRRTEMPSKNSKPVTSFLFGGTGADGGTISVMVREVFEIVNPAT
jgi:hypothetical protein